MATTWNGWSVPAAEATGNFTLQQLVDKWRARLDDILAPYLWSNEELTEYADFLQKMIFAEMLHFEDRRTPAVCQVALVQGDTLKTVSNRILKISRARLASQTNWLNIVDAADMDSRYPGWDTVAAPQAIPHTLVTTGMGEGEVYLYPPLLAATDSLRLVVFRKPLVDLDWNAHSGSPLEIDRFAEFLVHGIMWQAYQKQDADTYDPQKAEAQRILWEGADTKGGDKEKIRRIILKETSQPKSASPMVAFQ